MTGPRLFIDGAAGTVGAAFAPYFKQMLRDGVLEDVVTLGDNCRKVRDARRSHMAEADIVLLCLPDDVAGDAARMAIEVNPQVRILDASAAHRCDARWQYGMPELVPASAIREAQFVANPGCFATGCILLAEPLARHAALPRDSSGRPWLAFQGVTGYSAGGARAQVTERMPYLTQMGVAHRHLPEIERYAGVKSTLTTLVGDWYQGMLVQATVPLPAREVFNLYQDAYGQLAHITLTEAVSGQRKLSAIAQNGTNNVHIMVGEQPDGYSVVAAAFDNLGKGSAGAAAHNLRLMLT